MAGLASLLDSAKDVTSADGREKLSLISVGIPSDAVEWYQGKRREFGFEAPSPSGLVILGMVVTILFMALVQVGYNIIMKFFNLITRGFFGELKSTREAILFSLIVAFIIGVVIYFLYGRAYIKQQNLTVGQDFAKSLGATDAFQVSPQAFDLANTSLMDIQALGVKQTGYIGPTESNGNFDLETGIQSAIRIGVRFFTLQIDTLETKKSPDSFDPVGQPTLLYRDDGGVLISANGGNIKTAVEMFNRFAFNPEVTSATSPLVLYLHFVKTPNPLRKPEEYVKFLSDTAKMLAPLSPHLLGATPEGNYQRQQNELGFLKLPLSKLEKKVVFMTNVDTSLFRDLKPLGMKQYDNKADLDYYVNVRVYLESEGSVSLGATKAMVGGGTPSAVIVPFSKLTAMSEAEQDSFALKGKSRFVIAMPSQMSNPDAAAIDAALKRTGVNVVALNLFDTTADDMKAKLKIWKGEPFLSQKPAALKAGQGITGSA